MGLLDDAIREHLDLKRRNGADPAELEQAEREALGPVRREPEAIPEEPVFTEPAPPPEHFDEETQAWPVGTATPDLEDSEYEPEPPRRSRLSRIFGRADDEDEYLEEELEDPDAHAVRETRLEPDPEEQPEAPREDEDVLDQTPEFLQDTPDHDRLWFEQRPPRDFDFDG